MLKGHNVQGQCQGHAQQGHIQGLVLGRSLVSGDIKVADICGGSLERRRQTTVESCCILA